MAAPARAATRDRCSIARRPAERVTSQPRADGEAQEKIGTPAGGDQRVDEVDRDVRLGDLHVRRQRQVVPAGQTQPRAERSHRAGRTTARRSARLRARPPHRRSRCAARRPRAQRRAAERAPARAQVHARARAYCWPTRALPPPTRRSGRLPNPATAPAARATDARAPADAHDRHERGPDAVEAGEQRGAGLQVDVPRRIGRLPRRTLRDGRRAAAARDGRRAVPSPRDRSRPGCDRSTSMARMASRSGPFSASGSSATRDNLGSPCASRSKTQMSTARGGASPMTSMTASVSRSVASPFQPGARIDGRRARRRGPLDDRDARARATAPHLSAATRFRSARAMRRRAAR